MPAYNAEPYIGLAIESVLNQSYSPVELIIVNDGSKDRTLEVAGKFQCPRVCVIDQPNSGASAARNRAFRESKGEFIQYLDADDLLSSDKIKHQVSRLIDHRDCVSACRWGRFETDIAKTRFVPEAFWRDIEPLDFLEQCWSKYSMIQPGAWLTPRQIIENCGPWDESLSLNDDGEFFARVVLASKHILFCNDSELYYRSGVPGALSSRKSDVAWKSAYQSIRLMKDHVFKHSQSSEIKRAVSRLFEMFIFDSYPAAKELRVKSQKTIRELGGPYFSPPLSPKMKLVSKLIGWKAATRLRLLIQKAVSKR